MSRTALALASLLCSGTALAQTTPPPPPGDAPSSAPSWATAAPPPAYDPDRVPLGLVPVVPTVPVVQRAPGLMAGPEIAALYTTGALWGAGFGSYLAGAAIREDEGIHTVLLPLLGLGGGIAVAALIDRNAEVRRGRALAVHAGMWLGLEAGIAVAFAGDLNFERNGVNLGSHALFGFTTLGMIAGAGVAALTDARPGSVGFTFSLGLWGGYAGAMIESAVRELPGVRNRPPGAGILIGEGVGIAAGMLLASALEPTAAQARWMDLGGLSGATLGLLAGSLARGNDAGPFLGSLGGVIGGTLLGYFLGAPSPEDRQRNRVRDDVRGVRASAFVAPVQGGAVMGLSLL